MFMGFPKDALESTWDKTTSLQTESHSLIGLRVQRMKFGSYHSDWKLRGKNPIKRDHAGNRPQNYLYHPFKSLPDL